MPTLLNSQQTHNLMIPISILLILYSLPLSNSISFNFTSFNPNMADISFQGDAFLSQNVIQLTKNAKDDNLTSSVGRASYRNPVRIWDARTKKLADFTTHFSFTMKAIDPNAFGDGISFFMAPFNSPIPDNSSGGFLALFSPDKAFDSSKKNQIVAVEFDSVRNSWDRSENHVGININSIESVTYVNWTSSIKDGRVANAWISYNSTSQNLSIFLTYAQNPVFNGESNLSYIVDLREILPELVSVGFSASTGSWVELHNILSWNLTSNLEISRKPKSKTGLIVALAASSFGVSICGLGLIWLVYRRKRRGVGNDDEIVDGSMDDEFEKGTGPKRFTYRDLSRATSNFSEAGKLGEGGFGGVYKGVLSQSKTEIAVKRVSRGSKQGKKEYVSEVRIISRLRHRNLVQLIGWCHEKNELLLVYEFMPNGSLDTHLFGGGIELAWPTRYKIALGLASALLYLHEEWEQCVVHRDIKSSNVMLDSSFNAKLGDFGLARLVDHDLGSQTTVLAGTMGYLAPECVTTGKASKESDVYSFGVVALEITCGRRPVDIKQGPDKVRLIEWVWDLYGKGQILEAVDKILSSEFDERQLECLMIVGLWCCHPDLNHRPSIRQVINVLNFEAPLPSLPAKLPVPMYYAPPMDMCKFSYTSGFTNTGSTSSTNSSLGSAKSLLKPKENDV